ncbi:SCO3933 family regulatory protein [Actinoallomurus rhizosphaericola]|uniref:SCO3933 family regulatory protein n=1 Tax=Actinoallomurus rhizosphaericola TaxID=2952536 RepID=UPI0020916D7A|nr:hypothetical protein [Actinoallomurus rhizosphaericola]MCO5992998.1 hypothetical protein [Actinoallomurus rhizosphaericola]
MQNIGIPVDTRALTFVCVAPPAPKLVNRETGEVKVDAEGRTVFQVGLSVATEAGRIDLVTVNVPGDPEVQVGQIVTVSDLIARPWKQVIGGQERHGISFGASAVVPASVVQAA